MVIKKLMLCINDGLLDGLEMLRDVKTRLFRFRHCYNISKMGFSPFKLMDPRQLAYVFNAMALPTYPQRRIP